MHVFETLVAMGMTIVVLSGRAQTMINKKKGDNMLCKTLLRILQKLRQLNLGAGPCAAYKGLMQKNLERKCYCRCIWNE